MSAECSGCGRPMLSEATGGTCGTSTCPRVRLSERRAVLLRVAAEIRSMARTHHITSQARGRWARDLLMLMAGQYEREAA